MPIAICRKNVLVSVVIPTYNAASFIEKLTKWIRFRRRMRKIYYQFFGFPVIYYLVSQQTSDFN